MKQPGTKAPPDGEVSAATRFKVADPARATEELADSLRTWNEALSEPAVVAEMAAEGMTPGMMEFVAHSLTRNLDDMTRGKAEASAILAHLDRFALAGLHGYLKAHPITPECVAWLLAENRRMAFSLAASAAAKKRNADPRTWVDSQWNSRADKGQSKASFARMIVHEVKRRFGVNVTADRIARYWLPKG